MNYYLKRLKLKLECQIRKHSPILYKTIKLNQLKYQETDIKLCSVINTSNIDTTELKDDGFEWVVEQYLRHHFDILGSGWISFNKEVSSEKPYVNIAWNRDFRSGYVWKNEDNHLYDYKNPEGSDIKNVWELGRLQHLLRLSLLFLKNHDFLIANEFRCQVNDFMSHNPVGTGVHWTCSMEVAIRAINLLMSFDIFNASSEELFDMKFKKSFANYIYGHGLFIINNLEFVRKSQTNHNHYYADILGILYIGIYLNNSSWYNFAKKEFVRESRNQFMKDGANMEGSTCYHKMCTEMLQLGIAAIIHHDGKCKKELLNILFKATKYLESVTLPNDEIPQIGDNDNGHILSLMYYGYRIGKSDFSYSGFEQMNNNYRESTRNINSIFSRGEAIIEISCKRKNNSPLEKTFMKSIVGEANVNFHISQSSDIYSKIDQCITLPNKNKISTIIKGDSLQDHAKGWEFYPYVGICIYKSTNIYVCVNLGKHDINHFMGHIHDDVLGIEVWINGKPIIEDPGTLTYTANSTLRNLFRSSIMHYVPQYDGQMDTINSNAFYYKRRCKAEIVFCNSDKLCIKKDYFSAVHYRTITIKDDVLVISDSSENSFTLPSIENQYLFSDCYGSIIKKTRPVNDIKIIYD